MVAFAGANYRSALPRSEALAELERHSGTQFDPMVVQALFTAVDAVAHTTAPGHTS